MSMTGSRAGAAEEIVIVSGNAKQPINLRMKMPAFTITPKNIGLRARSWPKPIPPSLPAASLALDNDTVSLLVRREAKMANE
jgi:hypothetical protein